MLPKPKHLGPEYASVFQDSSVVEAYHNRPPYPEEAITFLFGLIAEYPRNILDAGCGSGDLTRPMAHLVDHVDAVDVSIGMIERGRKAPGGDDPRIHWIWGRVEDASLTPPYALIMAGESLHWMEWGVVVPRFASMLTIGGSLAIVERNWEGPESLNACLVELIPRFTTNQDFQPYDLITELNRRGLFSVHGQHQTKRVPWGPTIDEYIECRHSQNGLSRDRMGKAALRFDAELRQTLEGLVDAGEIQRDGERLALSVEARIVWGAPLA
jgi:SAM-dependent methyltransferase